MPELEQNIGNAEASGTEASAEVTDSVAQEAENTGFFGRFRQWFEPETPPSEIAGLIDDTSRASTGR